jgi:hypothetical protein
MTHDEILAFALMSIPFVGALVVATIVSTLTWHDNKNRPIERRGNRAHRA